MSIGGSANRRMLRYFPPGLPVRSVRVLNPEGGTTWISVKILPGVRVGGRIGGGKRHHKRRKTSPYWYHGTYTIHHRTQDAANRPHS